MNNNEIRALIREESVKQNIQIFKADVENPFQVHAEVLDLSTAVTADNPKIFNFAFKCIAFVKGTDTTLEVSGKLNSNDRGFSAVPFKNNSSLYSEEMFGGIYLSWAAQPGKSVTILLFLNAKFESGSFVNDGTVSIAPSSGLVVTNPAVAAATATLLIAANTSRKKVTIQNSSAANLFVGGSSVSNTGANTGYLLSPGSSINFQNTAALYGYSSAGSAVGLVTVMEEN